MTLTVEKSKYSEKNLSYCHFIHHTSQTGLGVSLGLYGTAGNSLPERQHNHKEVNSSQLHYKNQMANASHGNN